MVALGSDAFASLAARIFFWRCIRGGLVISASSAPRAAVVVPVGVIDVAGCGALLGLGADFWGRRTVLMESIAECIGVTACLETRWTSAWCGLHAGIVSL